MSFTKAALELHLTQSAISHQIRAMEDMLGVRLFERVRQRLVLTDVGRAYVEEIRDALERMQAATFNVLAHHGQGGVLRIATQPAIGMKWLIPRLGDFSNRHPGILISLVTRSKTPFDFASEPLDAAIHFGRPDWPDVIMNRLDAGEQVVVCAPGYWRRGGYSRPASRLSRLVLLQHIGRPDAWQRWLHVAEATGVNAWAGPRYEHFYMIVQAAVAGMGMALLPRLLVVDDLASGRLVAPFRVTLVSEDAYYLVYPEAQRHNPKVNVFRDWVVAEADRIDQKNRKNQ